MQREKLAIALAEGMTIEEAAAEAGIGRTLAVELKADPAFQQKIKDIRTGMVQAMLGTLTSGGRRAACVLLKLIEPEADGIPNPPHVRHSAARTLIESGFKARQEADFEERLRAVEERAGLRPASTPPEEAAREPAAEGPTAEPAAPAGQ